MPGTFGWGLVPSCGLQSWLCVPPSRLIVGLVSQGSGCLSAFPSLSPWILKPLLPARVGGALAPDQLTPGSSPLFAPPPYTSLPVRLGQPQSLRSPLPEPPATPGPETLGHVLLVPTALGMTHYSVSRGRIRHKLCRPWVPSVLSQLSSPVRPLCVIQPGFFISPFTRLSAFPLLYCGQSPLRVFLAPVLPAPYPHPIPCCNAGTQYVAFPLPAFPEGLEEAKGSKVQSGFSGRPLCAPAGCGCRSRAAAPGRVLRVPAAPLPERVRGGKG